MVLTITEPGRRPRRIRNTSAAGTKVDHAAIVVLRAHGLFVMRSAGSLGPADLIAVGPGSRVALIQSKRGGAREFGPVAWNEFYDEAQRLGAVPVLASRGATVDAVRFQRLTGRKTGRPGVRSPVVPWSAAEIAGPRRPLRNITDHEGARRPA